MFCGLSTGTLHWWHGQYFLVMGNSGKVNHAFTTLWPSFYLLTPIRNFPPCPSISYPYSEWTTSCPFGFPSPHQESCFFPSFFNISNSFLFWASQIQKNDVWIYTFINLKSYKRAGLFLYSLIWTPLFLNSSLMF